MGFDINSVTVSGNLTRDPELRSTSGGTSVLSLRIANNQRRKSQTGDWEDVAHYFDVTVWSGLGEWLARNLSKGDKVVAHGVLRWREYQDNAGNKRQAVDINAFDVVPVPRDGGGGSGGNSGFAPRSDVPASADDFAPRAAAPARQTVPQDDDIPF